MQRLDVPQAMKQSLRNYEQYCRDRRHLRETTLNERMTTLARFPDFLVSRGVQDLSHMQPADLAAYMASRQRFRPRTVSRVMRLSHRFWIRNLSSSGSAWSSAARPGQAGLRDPAADPPADQVIAMTECICQGFACCRRGDKWLIDSFKTVFSKRPAMGRLSRKNRSPAFSK